MKKLCYLILIAFFPLAVQAQEGEAPKKTKGQQILEKINFDAKLIMRYETDWDVIEETTGDKKADKEQLKYRANFGFDYPINDNFGFGFALITGGTNSQQASFNDFGDEFETDTISLYKAYVRAQEQFGDAKAWGWVGKNFRPFWLPSQTFWDSDANPEGFATGLEIELAGDVVLRPTATYFIIQQKRNFDNDGDGNTDISGSRFADHSYLAAGQLKAETGYIADFKFELASGYFDYRRILQPADVFDNTTNNIVDVSPTSTTAQSLDYQIINSALQITFDGLIFPLILTGEVYINLARYNLNTNLFDPTLAAHRNGYRGAFQLGKLKKAWDFMIGYEYLYIEKFALVDYLAQDNFVNTSTQSSNFKGHGIHAGIAFAPQFNLKIHYYLVEAIAKELQSDAAFAKGQRVRVDFTAKF